METVSRRQYYRHFLHMIERGKKVGCDFTIGLPEFNRWREIIGPVPEGMKRPSVGRYDHSKGYVFDTEKNRWNFRWQELSENVDEGLSRGREISRATKPGWIPTHRIGTKHTDETLSKMRDARNRIIAEKRASGEMTEIGHKISESKRAQNLGTRKQAILSVFGKDKWLSTQQVADKCGFGRDNAYNGLKELEKEGKVVMGITSDRARVAVWKLI